MTQDGCTFVDIDAGFEVAPGDASDIEVANAHAWGSWRLVFSDGAWASTARSLQPQQRRCELRAVDDDSPDDKKGTACFFPGKVVLKFIMMPGGKSSASSLRLQRDEAGRVKTWIAADVLLRKRA
jgi:hypothetical protein